MPNIPPEFTSLYRLFLRATSAAVQHHGARTKSLRHLYRPSFEAAASLTKRLGSLDSGSEEARNMNRWLVEFDKRINHTLEFLYNASISRGLQHRVISNLSFLARTNYNWTLHHLSVPLTPWNAQLSPDAPQYKVETRLRGTKKLERREEELRPHYLVDGGASPLERETTPSLIPSPSPCFEENCLSSRKSYENEEVMTEPAVAGMHQAFDTEIYITMFNDVDDASQAHLHLLDKPIYFEVYFGKEAIQHIAQCDSVSEDFLDNSMEHKSSLFSDDEFEPIRMKIAKRVPDPLTIESHRHDDLHLYDSALQPVGSVVNTTPEVMIPLTSPNMYAPSTSASTSTLFSVSSSSSTHVNSPTNGGRTFNLFDTFPSYAFPGVVTPGSIAGIRGLTNLRRYGYNFDWNRLAARTDPPHGLNPEDSAELEIFLSKACFFSFAHSHLNLSLTSAVDARLPCEKYGFIHERARGQSEKESRTNIS
ncbi:hypothetical protein EW145_g1866 [Phellinidium pouzarii]|uniref:Uncharacterized protein n=1 Tax=Phellinidium pouzarii TaxID=167371 RepID=A0A4V3XDG3_9AGAM|nr:hypothetical protein EW145_g1866 [Phellinidium pouzarii]